MKRLIKMIVKMISHPATLLLISGIMVSYTLLYLWLTGDMAGGGLGGWHATFPAWERVFEQRGAFQFEPVGLVSIGGVVWTFSPLNTLLAMTMGLLMGLNIAAGWWLRTRPRQCRLRGAGTSWLALPPALLAGGACCAPLILIWLGLPIAGALAGMAPYLVPGALLLLSVGLWHSLQQLVR
ncbi:hypothetical protein SAMN05192555_10451 [Franzmannia pantelleriensis]|uniref:Uncharacterized protein n=1 Tax=Franzmannia pantelleriensis TaxID=48727 RepID=A0A1G9JIG2_9GAMM|nr:hypothetical protein SAMN05192555_10451 [Halomonas pantelleriensis]